MVSSKQKSDIKQLMRRIKDAHDNGKSEAEINRRTTELYNYLEAEGIINRDE